MFSNMTIRAKVIAAFTAVFVIVAIMGGVGISRLAAVAGSEADIANNWLPSTGGLARLDAALQTARNRQFSVVMSRGNDTFARESQRLLDQIDVVRKARRDYEPMIAKGTDDERLIRKFDELFPAFEASVQKNIQLVKSGDNAGAEAYLIGESRQVYEAAKAVIAEDIVFNGKEGAKAGEEGIAMAASARTVLIATLILALIACAGLAFGIIQSVSVPIQALTQRTQAMANGDLDRPVSGTDRGDELGAMARSLQVFRDAMVKAREAAAQEAEAMRRTAERAEAMDRLIRAFEIAIADMLETSAQAVRVMDGTASGLADSAQRAARQTNAVAAASEEASANVQTVAAATEELTASIAEIARQVTEAATISNQAVSEVGQADSEVQQLAETASRIGDVVRLINEIASQTNLLALNATIEAARAGEHGKGFAVVASEVKNLAGQTAKATDEIASQISAIQAATNHTVDAIRGFGTTVRRINEISSLIAAAIEEQGAATREIAANIEQASSGTAEVSRNIVEVSRVAEETGSGAAQMVEASGMVSSQNRSISGEVQSFVTQIRKI